MSILTIKLLRQILRNKGQFLAAAAVIMVGVTVYLSMSTSYYNMRQSQEDFYRDNQFADYYFQVVKAPNDVIRQVEEIAGVKKAAGRISLDVPVLKEDDVRASARLITYSRSNQENLNCLSLLTGRPLGSAGQDSGIEVLLDPQYAAANNLDPGSKVNIIAQQKKVGLTVIGTAISPEFVYTVKDSATLMPDPKTFGVLMADGEQIEAVLGMRGQINQVLIQFTPDARQKETVEKIKDILSPYGNLASYPRKDQTSHVFLEAELDGLRSITTFLPLMFMLIAAGIQFVILRRMIRAQRMQIGLLKALGYSDRQVMLHYTYYGVTVGLAGAAAGTVCGLLLSGVISATYAQYFNLPGGVAVYNLQTIFNGFLMSLGTGIIAGLSASRKAAAINPAEAMRPEPPLSSGHSILERWPALWKHLTPGWKMSIRTVNRNRGRLFVTMFGVMFAVALLIIAFFTNDAIDYILQKYYNEEQSYDLMVHFNRLQKSGELNTFAGLDGVQKVEPVLELPVRLYWQGRTEEELLTGYPPDLTLRKISGTAEKTVALPDDGIILNERTADKLGVGVGDMVEVETLLPQGPVHRDNLKIMGLTRQLIGGGSYVSLRQANRVLRETNTVSGAMLKVLPGHSAAVEKEINSYMGVASVQSRQKELDNFNKNLESLAYSVSIIVLFAMMLGFAIVYSSSIISLVERRRELASLQVIGFSLKEVSGLLLNESILQTLPGIILGLPFGRLLAEAYVQSVNTDLYTLPVIIYPRTYFYAALLGLVFVYLAFKLTTRGLNRVDMVEVLKQGD